ncbi:MAG TPA: hypothetical protein VF600_10130 [Abditibacteriaceae bacterium]|jgi:hypothetical protein
MSFNFVEKTNSLTPEQRLHFYEVLAHNLTVSIRGIWSDTSISDVEKVDQMKWINEVTHMVTAKVYVLRLNKHEWTEEDTWELMEWAVSKNPRIKVHLAGAVMHTHDSITSNASD